MIDYSEQMHRDVALFDRLEKEAEENPPTKESALASLQSAGILDERGEFTRPYKTLGRWVKENNQGK